MSSNADEGGDEDQDQVRVKIKKSPRSDALGRRAVHRMMRTAQLLCVFAVVVAVGMSAEIGDATTARSG